MADFDLTQIPEITQQRLDQTAADTQQRAQAMFEAALAEQQRVLQALTKPVGPLMTATAERVPELVDGPPPPDRKPPTTDPQ